MVQVKVEPRRAVLLCLRVAQVRVAQDHGARGWKRTTIEVHQSLRRRQPEHLDLLSHRLQKRSVTIWVRHQQLVLTGILFFQLGLHLGQGAQRVVLEHSRLLLAETFNINNHFGSHRFGTLCGLCQLLELGS